MNKETARAVVCLSSIDWDPIWTRKQQVMSRLPQNYRVLYVEPPITLLSAFKDKTLWFKWTLWLKGNRPWRENIWLYSPPPVLPFGNKYRWINKINQWWQSLFIRRQIRKLGLKQPWLWMYLPGSVDIVDRLEHSKLIYDCVDEHSEYTGLIDKQVVRSMEAELCRRCDVVFVTALGLYEDKKGWNPRTYFIPNAANLELFGKAQDQATRVPPDLEQIPPPRLGFVGVIQDWVDLDLLAEVARLRPNWSVVLVGPVGAGIDVSALQALPNVYLLGRREQKELPAYLKGFDVCLNTFKINDLTRNVSPLKFYEYLASGKPIVSVDMPQVRNFADVVKIASTPAETVAAVEEILGSDNEEQKARRLARARENSWESRVKQMLEIILRRQ
ncbi:MULTISPECIES: glycosyltransferase [Carboxydocella]|uniref:Glycosyltransferase involved in cell wall bisynthesis n=2 Tax=Carboxydocella TaxID=178898 RepID=A0A1T4P097_9FIRM|nr:MULTISPECIES: glycosyltransferase [Carboxydocella]AVX19601.1 Glycosyltransferase involved in cell wall bisynthesis [Carboxydocella thermautotrophica]AVX30016.1 Glycosyltransferase involved in cell wall bisynthesis [Carboxydocella thermautotrophica]SJZ84915.1 Glycosyltransferase involved in cell wall bisynthesis [Carboxydocella sporoproducens DSM 16521]GAW29488.1 hypothetical protein ULO1_20580 [Carboxydocella sp. ULO1]GAW31263.1 hypothetical protein JDF658_10280 [Carboxydocella sp. JDF658]